MARATIKTIAEEAGVSIATVSKALNDMPDVSAAVKARIREIAQRQGYVLNTAARQLASGLSYTVGVVLPDLARRDDALLYQTLAQRLQRAGYLPMVAGTQLDLKAEATAAAALVERGVGVLVVVPATTETRHIEEAVRGRVPVVYVGGAVNPNALNTVACDDYRGGMLAGEELVRGGCRSVAVFTWGAAATAQYQRTRGFIACMQEHGVPVATYEAPGGLTEQAGVELAKHAMKAGLPEGIFATEDLLALGALAVFGRAGVPVPGQLQLVGYGDSPSAALELVRLTSIALPVGEVAICAGDMVHSLMRGERELVRRLTLEPLLVRRHTTRRAKVR